MILPFLRSLRFLLSKSSPHFPAAPPFTRPWLLRSLCCLLFKIPPRRPAGRKTFSQRVGKAPGLERRLRHYGVRQHKNHGELSSNVSKIKPQLSANKYW